MKIASSILAFLCFLPLAAEAEEGVKKVSLEVNVLSRDCQELEELQASIPVAGSSPSVSYDEWCESSVASLQKMIELINSKQLTQDLFWSISVGDKEETTKRLDTVAQNYIDLLDSVGTDQERTYDQEVASLFAPECTKIVNGAVWFEGAEHFIPQLIAAGENVGSWTVDLLDVIPGRDGRDIVVRYLLPTEKAGTWNALVILRCNDLFQIVEINEVFNVYDK